MTAVAPIGANLPLAQPNTAVEPLSLPREGEALGEGYHVPDEALRDAAFPFAAQLQGALETHLEHAHAAQQKSEAFANGRLDDIHGTMIALKEESIELRLIANVRTKILDAFNDLWRLNV